MSQIIITIASTFLLFYTTPGKNENCFSETNFNIVYQYLNNKTTAQDLAFYQFNGYEIHINDSVIRIKTDGWTEAVISKDGGISGLAKRQPDNDRQIKKANGIFCQLLAQAHPQAQ